MKMRVFAVAGVAALVAGAAQAATLTVRTGEVEVSRGGTASFVKAESGLNLSACDVVRVVGKGSARIVYSREDVRALGADQIVRLGAASGECAPATFGGTAEVITGKELPAEFVGQQSRGGSPPPAPGTGPTGGGGGGGFGGGGGLGGISGAAAVGGLAVAGGIVGLAIALSDDDDSPASP